MKSIAMERSKNQENISPKVSDIDILRFFTAGNVDDGKSTLIGRLLFDSDSVSTDIIEAITRQSKNKGNNIDIDLAFLTDGLRAEREQGITIDVAYKYFSTKNRKFIIADTPGHIQYTRNMFTGASTADLAIILIDIAHGITEQTRRHSIIVSILGISNILVCINKMDLVNYGEDAYNKIIQEYKLFADILQFQNLNFIPVSALEGENIIHASKKMPWFEGLSLLTYLETIKTTPYIECKKAFFQVQYVSNLVHPETKNISRKFLGKVLSGCYCKGDKISIEPEGIVSEILKIEKYGTEIYEAEAGDIISIQLTNEVDISRGNTFIIKDQISNLSQEFEAKICWMDNNEHRHGQKLLIMHHAQTAKAKISELIYKLDIHTYKPQSSISNLIHLNEICKVKIRTAIPLVVEAFAINKRVGNFILVDENTNNTVAAGIFLKPAE